MIYDLAQLSADQLKALKAFEESTGRTLLAFRSLPAEPDDLDDQEVARIQEMEKKLGLTLVAVRA